MVVVVWVAVEEVEQLEALVVEGEASAVFAKVAGA